MRTLNLEGYWDADARPGGQYAAAQIHGYAVETHAGRLTCPDTPRYCRIPTTGAFRIAVQGDGRTREWDGSMWLIHRESCGAGGPVIYDAAGRLHIADCAEVGSQGYRYVSPTGELVTGDASILRRGSELLESTDLGDGLIVGQGPHGGMWAQMPDGYRELVPGETYVIRAHRVGDQVAVACYTPVPRGSATAHMRWFTIGELRAMPATSTTAPPLPAPVPQPQPIPTPTPPPEVPVSSIPASEILAVVRAAKADAEAAGVRFRTKAEVDAYYAQYGTVPTDVKAAAMHVTIRAAWALAQRYPSAGIGLEAYGGVSGESSPWPGLHGDTRYSFDILLLSRRGPSVDIMASGVEPAAQIDPSTDPAVIAAWARDWREVLRPPTEAPTPQPEPTLPQPTDPDLAVRLSAIEAVLVDLVEAQTDHADALTHLAAELKALRERPFPPFPTYRGRAGILGTVTLTPEGQ